MKTYLWKCRLCGSIARTPQQRRCHARFFGKLHGKRVHGDRKIEPEILIQEA